jgi:hypothetical protein
VRGVSAPAVGGQARDGQDLVAGVMLWGTGSRDVRQEAAGRVALGGHVMMGPPVVMGRLVVMGGPVLVGRPVMVGRPVVIAPPAVLGSLVVLGGPVLVGRPVMVGPPVVMGGPVPMRHLVMPGSPVITSSPVVPGAGRGSGALGAAQAGADHQTGLPESGRAGRAKPGTATGPRKTVEQRGGTGRSPGHSRAEMVAGKAVAAPASVHLLRGVAVMAGRAVRAPGRRAETGLRRRAAVGLGRPAEAGLGRRAAARAQTGHGGSLVPGATIGTYGGHPARSG